MQIKIRNKRLSSLPKNITRIELIEKGPEVLKEKGGTQVLQIQTGKLAKVNPRTFRTLVRNIVQTAERHKLARIALSFTMKDFPGLSYGEAWALSTLAENILLSSYTFDAYKSTAKRPSLREVIILGAFSREGVSGFKRGLIVGEHANRCRDISNTPGGDMTPRMLGEKAKELLKGTPVGVSILDEAKLRELGMGGVLGVGKGAFERPCFIVLEYWGAGKPKVKKGEKLKDEERPIVFVGKGVTFDTGGLQVKPGMAMYEMHMDMSGGAAVIAALGGIARLGIKKNVVGLIPAVENAISDRAIRPGDILKMMSGKTVDVLHTDAEGRIILADALTYAKRYEPRLVIDIATLTGASMAAVGQHAHVIMTKDRALEDTLRDLGEESGDYTFPLPLWDEYLQYTKGIHGDISNVPQGETKAGGAINGGMFLSHFAEKMRWAHIDMAPRMTATPQDKLTKGATGEPTRLLVKIAETL